MMRSNHRVATSLILVIVAVLSVCLPVLGQAAAPDAAFPDKEDKLYCLQEIGWYNHQLNLGSDMSKASTVGKKSSSASGAYTGSYVGPYGEVYKTKQINDTTMVFTSIALPIGMTEYEVPSEVVLYKLIYSGTGEIPDIESLRNESERDVSGKMLAWDFRHEGKTKENVAGYNTYEIDGKQVKEPIIEITYSGPLVSAESHRFQVVSIEKCFSGTQTRVEKVKLPSIIKTIGASAFADNPYIKEVYGSGIEEVSSKAFYNCKNLEIADFPELRYVRDNAFYKCNHLSDLDFSNVLCIGKAAFFDCVQFTHVNFSTEIQQLEAQAFKQCTGIKQISIPEGISISEIPSECFYLCTALEDIQLPADIITIGSKAFYNCSTLRVLDFTKTNLDTINAQAFWGCLNLSYVLLPETLVTFKTDAFNNCPELRYVYFSHEITKAQLQAIEKSELANCSVTRRDTEGPALYNKTTKHDAADKIVTIYAPTSFVFHDAVDVSVSSLTGDGLVSVPDHKLDASFTGYKVYTDTYEINVKGTYTLTASDILGNQSTYTVKYISMPGDVDSNGTVEPADARLALRASVRLENYANGTDPYNCADYDNDGTITSADARTILRVSVGLDAGNAKTGPAIPPLKAVKVGDVMYEDNGIKVVLVDVAGNVKDPSITVRFVNTTNDYKETAVQWQNNRETKCVINTRLSKNHTFDNEEVLKDLPSLDNFTLYFRVFNNATESAEFYGHDAEYQLSHSVAYSFEIKN